jgi:hypothetical protein
LTAQTTQVQLPVQLTIRIASARVSASLGLDIVRVDIFDPVQFFDRRFAYKDAPQTPHKQARYQPD